MADVTEFVNPDGPPGGGSTAYSGQKQGEVVKEKPEGIPDKFWNPEKGEVDTVSLLSSYTELEKKIGTDNAPTTETQESVPETSQSDTFQLGKYEDEYRSNDNSLKEETYTDLKAKFGLERNEVDKYIQYRQSEADEFTTEIFNMAVGEEQYRSLLGWAGNTLSSEEVDALNKILTTGERDEVRVAVMKLNNRYRESVGSEPLSPVSGSTGTNQTGPKPFSSIQEAVEARKDKRYELDPSYRQQWENRVASSPFIHTT